MKIILCTSFVPFVDGGGRFIVKWLADKLQENGHEVETVELPFHDNPDTMFRQIAAFRMLDLREHADKLIAFRPPAYVVPHPNKVLWFIHHFRAFYDLWGTPHGSIMQNSRSNAFRKRLVEADTIAIGEAQKVFTNSRVVSERLRMFNGIESEVLYPPVYQPERFKPGPYGDEILCVCRMAPIKRQHLLIEAMRFATSKVKLRLCGLSASSGYYEKLAALVKANKVHDRVIIDHRWISEEEKAELLRNALAVAYAPVDEDSYGYPTIEGALAEKCTITAVNSGGTLEFIEDGRQGFVCGEAPEHFADRFDLLYRDRQKARQMGLAARQRLQELRIDWAHVVERILS